MKDDGENPGCDHCDRIAQVEVTGDSHPWLARWFSLDLCPDCHREFMLTCDRLLAEEQAVNLP